MNRDFRDELRELVSEHPSGYSAILRGSKYPELMEWVLNATEWLGDGYSMATRVYCALNDITEFPKCARRGCTNTMKGRNVVSVHDGWRHYCSNRCAGLSEERIEKTKATSLERYGSTSFLGSEKCKSLRGEWCRRQGVENPFQLDWVNEKRGKTMVEKYGHEFTQQCPELVEKCKETCRKHFGADHQWKSAAVREKNRRSTVEKYGTDNVFDVPEIRKKQKDTLRRQRYGTFASNDKVIPLFSLEDYINCEDPKKTVFRWRCVENGHNKEFESLVDENTLLRYGAPARCWDCHPDISKGFSREELAVAEFLRSRAGTVVQSREEANRAIMPGREIDILLPEKKVGIEFDGLFFHSDCADSRRCRDRHVEKTEYMESIGWRLLHVFEDEWNGKRDIVESRLLAAVGVYERKIYARKCRVEEIDSLRSGRFLDANHLQGDVRSKVRLGLFMDGELVAVMTFGRPRFNRGFEWELLRYASLRNVQVVGGAGKLLRHFERVWKPPSLVSYADRRWSAGGLYKSLGFEFVGNSPPNYFYTDGDVRLNRMGFQKHKLGGILADFDPSKSEKENMFANGYRIIYDCGNMVFSKRYTLQ